MCIPIVFSVDGADVGYMGKQFVQMGKNPGSVCEMDGSRSSGVCCMCAPGDRKCALPQRKHWQPQHQCVCVCGCRSRSFNFSNFFGFIQTDDWMSSWNWFRQREWQHGICGKATTVDSVVAKCAPINKFNENYVSHDFSFRFGIDTRAGHRIKISRFWHRTFGMNSILNNTNTNAAAVALMSTTDRRDIDSTTLDIFNGSTASMPAANWFSGCVFLISGRRRKANDDFKLTGNWMGTTNALRNR